MAAKCVRFVLALTALCLLVTFEAFGQSTGGSISGTVKDQTGPVPQAQVQVVNAATGQSRFTFTDDAGHYGISEIPPGRYTLRITASGYNPVEVGTNATSPAIVVSVAQVAKLEDIMLAPASGKVTVEVADLAMTDQATPTLSTSFSEKQIRDLPILTRDANNLALQAPGVFSVRTFSFASTLVPFSVNGSRGRDNNFIIDSVDNNEPLFGGAATQFTNTDLFAEYRILTNQYQAEYGRNSGSVVNIITNQGGNQLHGTAFWFAQSDRFDALTSIEKQAGLTSPALYYENTAGGTLGGPIKKGSSWFFLSYQWDRARNDLSSVYPVVATLPTSFAGLPSSPTVSLLSADPTAKSLPGMTSPCGATGSGLPANNPCTTGSVPFTALPAGQTCTTTPADCTNFGTYLVPHGDIFDVRDHQLSGRWDKKLGEADSFYARYLFDDLLTPQTALTSPVQVAFAEFGLLPQWRDEFAQRTQNAGAFWTHAWAKQLNELRVSYSRISSQDGSLTANSSNLPAVTISDTFTPYGGSAATNNFLNDFPAAGKTITIGSDSTTTSIRSNIFQVQENFSITKPRHTLKFGADFIRTRTDVNQIAGDLGHYFYTSFQNFVSNAPSAAFERFGNLGGTGGELLPIRETGQFYFAQDDIRVSQAFTLNVGIRYENYGPAYNSMDSQISATSLSSITKVGRVNTDFAPRVGFAWALGSNTVIRGGYGIYYDPTFFNIALLAWQSGPISPFISGAPTNVYPKRPFNASDVAAATIANTAQNTVVSNLKDPLVHSWSLGIQRQMGKDFLVQVSYVGSKGKDLFQRLDLNPNTGWQTTATASCPAPPCYLPRTNAARGDITEVTNGAYSNYDALQVSATKRLRSSGFWNGLAITGAYTWSHMLDNASEIFGPGLVFASPAGNVSFLSNGFGSAATAEVITPFPQSSASAGAAEYGNSSFDRRHRGSLSVVYALPSPTSRGAAAFAGHWEINGLFTVQSGQPFTPLNGFSSCLDANGDGILTNDRPSIGNPSAPANSVALLKDPACVSTAMGYMDGNGTTLASLANVRFVQSPLNVASGTKFTVGSQTFTAGSAGRNILLGPKTEDLDMALVKSFPFSDHYNLQFRAEFYDLLNRANPGNPFGNVFTANAQLAPSIAFGPTITPARVTGATPENAIDARSLTGASSFLSQQFMNTSSRRIQLALKFIF